MREQTSNGDRSWWSGEGRGKVKSEHKYNINGITAEKRYHS
jgi:hypothetical protein